jgi:PAS domain S-box-containing protein
MEPGPGNGNQQAQGQAQPAGADPYRLALETAGHVYFEYDPRSRRIVLGTPWTVLGYAADEVSPSMDAWMDLVHPEDRGPLQEGMRRQHQGGVQVYRIEYRMRARDGSWRAVLVSSRALARDPDGVPIRTAGTLTDVTDARALREQLAAADRLVSLGTLASGIAHAVNNPLASVASTLKLMQEELDRCVREPARIAEKAQDLRQALADAMAGADRVRDVVRGLQLFSSPRPGGAREAVELRAELDAALDLTRNALAQRARLTVDLPTGMPRVVAVPGELGQAFVNLFMKAAEAIPEGAVAEHAVRVVARQTGGRAIVEVQESGAGLRAQQPPRASEPSFYQASAVSPGAALSVCHGVVTGVGGSLELISDPVRGATYRVTLPAAPPAPAPTRASVSVTPPRGRVLIIDDDPLVGRSMARLLQAAHEVTVFTSPAEALARLEKGERWDAILCDLMMPELSGMDVAERLAKTAPDVLPRIVYLTGGAFTDRARAFLAEGRPYLEKPVEAPALRARVAELVKR